MDPDQDAFGGWTGFSAPNRPMVNGLDAECLSRAGYPPASPAIDEEMIADHYDAELRQFECLRSNAYPVVDPPTKQVYVETYETGPPWSALSGTRGLYDEVEMEKILEACPFPDVSELFGPTTS